MMLRCLLGIGCLALTGSALQAAGAVARHFSGTPDATSHERAGFPQEVKPHAMPANSPHSTGGYVGGGRLAFPKKQDGRQAYEGTWGWDYVGFGRRPGRVFLDFWHGRKHEPAVGTYETDGPEVPDPIAARPIQKFLSGEKREKKEEGAKE
jgi:hypothetical protein